MEKLEVYGGLIGRQVFYVKDGKQKVGILRSVGFSENDIRAQIEKNTNTLQRLMGGDNLDEVPLRQVEIPANLQYEMATSYLQTAEKPPTSVQNDAKLPTLATTSQCKSTDDITIARGLQKPQYFHYNQIAYQSCRVNGLSLDEEVVWLTPPPYQSLDDNAYHGKVLFIGNHVSVTGVESFIAVVHFNQNTSHLPRYDVTQRLGHFSNVVDVDELVPYSTWLIINHQEELEAKAVSSSKKISHACSQQQHAEESASSVSNSEFLVYDEAVKSESQRGQNTESDLIDFSDNFANLSINDEVVSPSNEDWRTAIDFNRFSKIVTFTKESYFGIQGKNSSCYMDACLFSLFAFNHALDELISTETDDVCEISDSVKVVLRFNIIKPLRQNYFVDSSKADDLRQILATAIDPEFQKSFMDAEDFIITLLQVLNIPQLFEYDNGVGDYVHQIFLPSDFDCSRKQKMMSVKQLLEGSFKESGLKLRQPPKELFIIKLPVSNGKLIPCDYVVPDLQLDLSTILSPSQLVVEDGVPRSSMSLSAVICLRHSHYTAFVKTDKDKLSPWIFMNSNPTTRKPKVAVLHQIGSIMASLLKRIYENCECKHWDSFEQSEKDFAKTIASDAYICIYEYDNY